MLEVQVPLKVMFLQVYLSARAVSQGSLPTFWNRHHEKRLLVSLYAQGIPPRKVLICYRSCPVCHQSPITRNLYNQAIWICSFSASPPFPLPSGLFAVEIKGKNCCKIQKPLKIFKSWLGTSSICQENTLSNSRLFLQH